MTLDRHVFVSLASLASPDRRDLILSSVACMEMLGEAGFRYEELAPDAVASVRVRELVEVTRRGGIAGYLYATRDPIVLDSAARGLSSIGAHGLAARLADALTMVRSVGAAFYAGYDRRGFLGGGRVDWDARFDAPLPDAEYEAWVEQHAAWLRAHPHLKPVSEDELRRIIEDHLETSPELAAKKRGAAEAWDERLSRETRLIRLVAHAAGQTLVRIAGSDAEFEWHGVVCEAQRFFTNLGLQRVFELEGQAIMLRGRTHEVVVTVPVPDGFPPTRRAPINLT